MLPENSLVEVESTRVRRLLKKLLDKIADLETETATGSDTPKQHEHQRLTRRPKACTRDSSASKPPAHPFGHLLLKQQSRPLRYTYKRRRCQSAGSDSDTLDSKHPPPRSASLESLSDSEAALGQDPAQWLTTPRKRHRRGSSTSIRSFEAKGSASVETRSQSFSSRLETMVVPADSSTNQFKAMYLLSHLVSLGETLWLGGATDDQKSQVRVLPLRVTASFRLGEAIGRSDGCDDFEYIDEIYDSIPPTLVRFVLWQHAVTMCYLRIPLYADTISEALWQVGAFVQQKWLVLSRLADLAQNSALLEPASIAPLHLRAIDIGIEGQFVTSMLQFLAADSADNLASDNNRLLWMQFVSAATKGSTESGEVHSDDITHTSIKTTTSAGTDLDGSTSQRYAKWVARISNTTQSIRILRAALVQVLAILSPQSICQSPCASAADALKSIFTIVLSKLSNSYTMPDNERHELIACLWSYLSAFANVTGVEPTLLKPIALQKSKSDSWQAIVDTCLLHQTHLTLLLLCHYRLQLSANSTSTDQTVPLVSMAKHLISWLCDDKHHASLKSKENTGYVLNKRSTLVARFDGLLEKVQKAQSAPASLFSTRILENIVLPLATVGVSPMLFHEIARISAEDLGKRKAARSILKLTMLRFDAIWDRYFECRIWHRDWSQLQTSSYVALSEVDCTDKDQKCLAQLQLGQLCEKLEQHCPTSKPLKVRATKFTSDAPEDEMSLLLSRHRRCFKRA